MSLKEYNKKRDFSKTSEPKGNERLVKSAKQNLDDSKKTNRSKANKKDKRKLFVIQYHLARREHYDVRFELNGVLISFAVPKGPSFNIKDKRLAVKVEDHPMEYANFEGVIPKGEYGGGIVMLWDKGEYNALEDFKTGLKKGTLKFEVFAERIKGKWTLIKLKNGLNGDNWLLIKEKDEYAKTTSGISKFTKSIKSGLTSKQIENKESVKLVKNPFNKVEPKLAKLVTSFPNDKDYIYEIKFDGYRIITFIENGRVTLKTRNNVDFTHKFPEIVKSLEDFSNKKSMVLDGEMIVQDEQGLSNFGMLQSYLKNKDKYSIIYMVFDLISYEGKDLRNLQLLQRKDKLEKLFEYAPLNIQYSEHINNYGQEMFENACNIGLEGVIAKKKNSVYNGKRDDDWLKIKCYRRQEFVIGGYVISSKKEHGISALLLGVYENNNLIYMGKTGTGINSENAKELKEKFKNLIVENSPFKNLGKSKEQVVFFKPKLIAEVQFAEVTKDGNLRQASFKGLREDKKAKEVVLEDGNIFKNTNSKYITEKTKANLKEIENKNIKQTKNKKNKIYVRKIKKSESDIEVKVSNITITSPDKIVFKKDKIRKIDIINYYEKVSKRMLKYVSNRLLSVVRCHEGLDCFYKKHPNFKSEYLKIKKIKKENKSEDYFYINSKEGIILEAQLGTIEFHIWGSKVDNINKPDLMVFDLDPDEKLDIEKVREGVKDLKSILNQLKLKSFLKTSGGKGYHVVVPFNCKVGFEKFKAFSEKIASIMVEKWPMKYTMNIRKENRKGKILIDYFRNGKGATSVAPYSLRARDGAKVSMPISWKELDKILPNEITISMALKRIKKNDPWKNFFNINQEIK